MKKNLIALALFHASLLFVACNGSQKTPSQNTKTLSDTALLTLIEKQTFQYFWEGAEPNSGAARERYHVDGIYPQNDAHIVATGATGFGLSNIIVAIERKFISKEEGVTRLKKIFDFLAKADRFHGAWPHWINGNTGKVKPFGTKDNGGDLVETSFLAQGLLVVRQYFKDGSPVEKALAAQADELWKGIDFNWYRNGKNVLYWHWSPQYQWEMNFAVTGYNECLIMYVLAASSPTHSVPAEVYHQGWAQNGKIKSTARQYNLNVELNHNGHIGSVGPMFWAHYSYLGLNPKGLKDTYADYWILNRNQALIQYKYAEENPNKFKGYGKNGAWGLTSSYSVKGYAGHAPNPKEDLGVIAPTAALASYPYTPEESLQAMRYMYEKLGAKVWGEYGFYDAYSETENWYPQQYLGIDQGPIVTMIENGRTALIWNLFMSCPEVQKGLTQLGFSFAKP